MKQMLEDDLQTLEDEEQEEIQQEVHSFQPRNAFFVRNFFINEQFIE